ncbi:MAG: 6-phosphogluconolactonase [Thermomicrobiales bacterium]
MPFTGLKTIDYGERGTVVVVQDGDTLATTAAETLISVIAAAAAEDRDAIVALSGGSTPKKMGALLRTPEYAGRVRWDRLQAFWGDERWVSIEDPESNAGEALRGFLEHVAIPAENVHPWETDPGSDPAAAADRYERLIREVTQVEDGAPRFDLIFLGMGDDGHTLSLFPHTSAVHNHARLAVENEVPKLNTTRLTFTPALANAAAMAVFLLAGAGKAERLHQVLDGPIQIDETPCQVIRPTDGTLIWLVDEAAAAQLDRTPTDGQ